MDIKSLKLFQHLAQSLHFSDTAQAMFVSPPTLSRAIARLEEEFDVRLFERNNRNVEITKSGQQLLTFCDDVLQKYAQLQATIKPSADVLSGKLSLFCSVTAAQTYLPEILRALRQHYPLVEIQLETGDHSDALDQVSANKTDACIAVKTPDFPSNLAFTSFDTVPLSLIVPKQMTILNVNEVHWPSTKVILPARGPSRRIVHHWFAEHNIRPDVYAQVSGNEAIVSMVALGLGVGFVPKIVLENSVLNHAVTSIPVADIEPYQLGLCYQKQRMHEPTLQAIINLVTSTPQ